jgi:predicted molibdopterin-dependent oxidoreductase YjgC
MNQPDFIIFTAGGLMFKRLNHLNQPTVTITIEDRQIEVPATDSVAAAMLGAGIVATRTTPVSGAPRGPYCMMGTCFECLVEIDGVSNQQACRTQVREGMQIAVQQGPRDVQS